MADDIKVPAARRDRVFRVAIVGAGPAGLATALALRSAAGRIAERGCGKLEITLFAPPASVPDPKTSGKKALSQRPDPRAVDQWPSAYAALARLCTGRTPPKTVQTQNKPAEYVPRPDERLTGVWIEGVKTEVPGYEFERYDFRSTTGQLLWSMPAGAYGRELGQAPRVVTLEQVYDAIAESLRPNGLSFATKLFKQCAAGPNPTQIAEYVSIVGAPGGSGTPTVRWIPESVGSVVWHADASVVEVQTEAATLAPADGQYDLVLGCDGPTQFVHRNAAIAWKHRPTGRHPKADSALFPDTDASRIRSKVVAISGCTPAGEDLGGDLMRYGQGVVFHGQDVRFGAWRCPENPTTGQVRWTAFVPRDLAFPAIRGAFGDGHDEDARDAWIARLNSDRGQKLRDDLVDRMRELFDGFPATIDRLIALTSTASRETFQVLSLADRAPDRAHWVAGRVALLGDAAHPILPDLGLALTMAFEDAAELAERVEQLAYHEDGLPDRDVDGDERLTAALVGWRDARFARVASVISSSRLAHETVHARTKIPQWSRDLTIAVMAPYAALHGKETWFEAP